MLVSWFGADLVGSLWVGGGGIDGGGVQHASVIPQTYQYMGSKDY